MVLGSEDGAALQKTPDTSFLSIPDGRVGEAIDYDEFAVSGLATWIHKPSTSTCIIVRWCRLLNLCRWVQPLRRSSIMAGPCAVFLLFLSFSSSFLYSL